MLLDPATSCRARVVLPHCRGPSNATAGPIFKPARSLVRKKRYFTEHLIVATHFWSFALLVIGVFIPILLLLLVRLGALFGLPPGIVTADVVPTVIIQAVFAPYLFLMLRRVYRVSRWYAGLLAASIAWSFFHIVWLFRFLLFVVTLRLL